MKAVTGLIDRGMHTNTLEQRIVLFPCAEADELAPFSFLPPSPNGTICPRTIDIPRLRLRTELFLY